MTISLTKRSVKGSPLTAAEHDANLTAIEGEVNPPIVTAEITDDAVTNAKLANMAAGTYKMRVTASTGDPEDATATQATAGLNVVTSALKGLAPASGGGTANFLRADATWAAPAGGGGLTNGDAGDITVGGGGASLTIDNDAVTLAKLANAAASSRLLGSGASGAGADYAEIALGTNLSMSGTTLNATGGGATDSESVTYLAPATSSVSRTTEAKLFDMISVKDFGATGNGTTNDLPALNAASAAACVAGRTIYFPPGIYRITGQWLIGNTIMGTDFSGIITEDASIPVVFDNTQINLSKNLVAPSIVGAAGAVIWGDFTPSVTTPIVYYGVDFTQGNANVYNTPAMLDGLSIVGKPGYVSGVATDGSGDGPHTGTKQIGLATGRGLRVVRNLEVRACQVAVMSQSSYWVHFDTIDSWRCEVGFRFKDANAVVARNLLMVFNNKGIIYDGGPATISDFTTETVVEDLIVQNAEGTTFGPAYLEDVSATDGTGKYAITLGVASGGNTVNFCTFQGIKIGDCRPNKGGMRYWGSRKNTFIGMRQAGKTLVYDSVSGGVQVASDYAIPKLQMPQMANPLDVMILGADGANHFDKVRAGWLDSMSPGDILPGQSKLMIMALPAGLGLIHGDYVSVTSRTTPDPGITFRAEAVADGLYVSVTNSSNRVVNQTFNLIFFSYHIPTVVYNVWDGPYPYNKGTQPAGITATLGDSGATYTLSHPSAQVQRAGTTFTANRTVTLPTLTTTDFGVRYIFLKDATVSAFTWTIGSAGVIPVSVKASMTVEWDTNTSTWRQVAYGVLA